MTAAPKHQLHPQPPALLGWGRLRLPRLGELHLSWSERGVVSLSFGNQPPDELRAACDALSESVVPAEVIRFLQGYAEARGGDVREIPVDLWGTPFQLAVWAVLRAIPLGQVRTYASVAAEVGSPRAMRAVGMANGANRVAILVPCHRVVETGMGLGGYSGGLDHKRTLLELEGARIVGDRVQPGQLSLGLPA